MLRAIDISSWQAGIVPSWVDCDVVIVKATGGTGYLNPYWREWADDVLASGRLLALYHFANDLSWNSASAEAEWFLSHVRDYKGQFIPILDWEGMALNNPVSWAREWLDIVSAELGATPIFYAYASYVAWKDLSSLSHYPLWMASYLNKYDGVGWVDNPDNVWGTGSWDKMVGYQYTSTGYIGGYGGRLDLSVFYMSRDDWTSMQGGRHMVRVNEIAAAIHRHMCECPKHGYTQGGGRWGQGPNDPCYIEVCGRTYEIPGNDYDCSSSVKKAWEVALQGSPYEGCFGYNGYDKDGAWRSWYTGNEIDLFVGSGLFSWEPMSFIADTGDLYLNVEHHVAMCQTQVPDILSEFLSNEWGGIEGGQIGDQTGGESVVRAFWWPSFGWDGILHYNGKADFEGDDDDMSILTYKNPSMNGDKDVYQLLTDIHNQLTRTDTAGWENPDGHDFFGRTQDIEKTVREIADKLDEPKQAEGAAEFDYEAFADAVAEKLDMNELADILADKLAKRLAE